MDKVLLIEDDINLGKSLVDALVLEGLNVDLCQNLAEARAATLEDYKLVLLDWMLPDGQGIDFLKEIKEQGKLIPVIMLTARNDLIDKVVGLESGANDYITKPFEARELTARIRVQLREFSNVKIEETNELLNIGSLEMDAAQRIATYESSELVLTKMEFDLLFLLATNPKQVFSREKLLDKVWGFDNYPTTRTVDTHVLQIRQKINNSIIETVRGVGYQFSKNLTS